MKPKTILLGVVAIVCGLGAMWLTNRLLAEKTREGPVAEAREKVLVARAKIPSQTLFKDPEKYFEEREVPASGIPKLALRSLDRVKDKRVAHPLAEGTYVFPEDLVSPETDGLGATLPAGMRAVTIRVQPDSIVAGFVLPHSHVDVLCTVRNTEGSATYTILENIEVLAVDNKHTRSSDDQPYILGTTATLAATPDECNLLKMAASNGELALVLRGIGDDKATRPQSSNQKALVTPHGIREGGDPDAVATNTGGALPPVPALPPVTDPMLPMNPPAPMPEPVKTEPELEVFIMTITTGTSVEKFRFLRKPGDPWAGEERTGAPPAAPHAPRPRAGS